MEGGALGLLGGGGGGGGGGGSSGSSTNESTVSKVVETDATSYPAEAELELGLGLSLGGGGCGGQGKAKASGGGGAWGECGRILTAKDFPSVVSQAQRANKASPFSSVSGIKRAADSEGGSPTSVSQVVGWPPIRSYRMNSLVNHAKAPRSEEEKPVGEKDKSGDALKKKICNGNKANVPANEKGHLGFVKVNMDGIPIGRKVDLNAHACYETLAQALEDMFFRAAVNGTEKEQTKPSKLLDGSSEFVLTYEDKEGDWMLVGDVPWGMFLSSVRRLRIMRTAEANGLAPRFQDRNEKQTTKSPQTNIIPKSQISLTISSLSLSLPMATTAATEKKPNANDTDQSSLCNQNMDELRKVFDQFDANKDGRISVTELGSVLQAMGTTYTDSELRRVMDDIDTDCDGYISLEEFASFCRSSSSPSSELKDAFDLYDQDKNGLISSSELHLVLNRLGMKCSEVDCVKMIESVDSDGDGNVNFEEFQQMMSTNLTNGSA